MRRETTKIEVRCDGCGVVIEGEPALIVFSGDTVMLTIRVRLDFCPGDPESCKAQWCKEHAV